MKSRQEFPSIVQKYVSKTTPIKTTTVRVYEVLKLECYNVYENNDTSNPSLKLSDVK